jgi:3-methyladenine DNA glycosylase AlkD
MPTRTAAGRRWSRFSTKAISSPPADRLPASGPVEELDRQLRAAGSPERAEQEKRYLKSDLGFCGASVPAIKAVVRAFLKAHPNLDRAQLLDLVSALWSEPVFERRLAAVELLDRRCELLKPEDVRLVERLLRESKTWALVDDLAANIAGSLAERYPEIGQTLDRWAGDDDFWVRRSALLALLKPLRRGEGDFERFARYADPMLGESEFFIRKAIGWVLREVSKKRPDLVFDWLAPRAQRASGVTLREAVKYLSPEQQRQLALRTARSLRSG